MDLKILAQHKAQHSPKHSAQQSAKQSKTQQSKAQSKAQSKSTKAQHKIKPHKQKHKSTVRGGAGPRKKWGGPGVGPGGGGPPGVTRCPESPNVCCEDIFNNENAQKPLQFNEIPRKFKKKRSGDGKKRELLDGPGPVGAGSGGSQSREPPTKSKKFPVQKDKEIGV